MIFISCVLAFLWKVNSVCITRHSSAFVCSRQAYGVLDCVTSHNS